MEGKFKRILMNRTFDCDWY